jgi:undecaprenyl-diphosphatase
MVDATPTADYARRLRGVWREIAARRKTIALLLLGIAVPLLVFGALAEDILENERLAFDAPLQSVVHQWSSPTLDAFMLALSRVGSAWFTVPLDVGVALQLIARRRLRQAGFWITCVAGAAVLNAVGKPFFARERPVLWPSPAPETTFSFPSGHAMHTSALVVALVVLLWNTRWRYPALVLGCAFLFGVGLSRVYLGVHYPSDVLAGWAASTGWVAGMNSLFGVWGVGRHTGKGPG